VALKGNFNSLVRISFFSHFEPEALRLVAFAAQPLNFLEEEVLFQYGQQSDGGYLIVSGAVRTESAFRNFGKQMVVGPGALVGARALIIPTRNLVSAIACENTVTMKISRDVLRRVLEEFPATAMKLQTVMKNELRLLGLHLKNASYEVAQLEAENLTSAILRY